MVDPTPPSGSAATPPPAPPAPKGTPKAAPKPAKEPKAPKPVKDQKTAAPAAAAGDGGRELTPKELKEKKKAEKAARRAETKGTSGAPPSVQAGHKPKEASVSTKGGAKTTVQQPVAGSGGIVKTIYVTSGGSGNQPAKTIAKEVEVIVEPAKDRGLVGLLRDLSVEQNEKKKGPVFGLGHAHVDVHPAILTLGMQINQYVLSGSTARCIGFLLAMKRVIQDYETPPASSLSRHLPGHYLSHQIAYLLSARPMSTAMGNTIRWLKQEISTLPPDQTQEASKKHLIERIENFIREKLTIADDMIVKTTVDKYIRTGDTLLTYGKSQVVERALLEAHRQGRIFSVIVVDNRPLLEGKNLLQGLAEAGIRCEYVHLYGLEHSISSATRVLLGAHAIMADGALYSRSGTAIVATTAREYGIPVVVCCESIKFSDKINLDGIVSNELGDPELLVNMSDTKAREMGPLQGWKDIDNMRIESFRYDVTPSECIKAVVCEHGCVAPKSVASVLRSSMAAAAAGSAA
ncbi:hypothetical protein DFP73DRAFT_620508 [Morchella snyderi]|nr:hypothetical protein DFP73DRAFT_620508 [Morchella snyderi]